MPLGSILPTLDAFGLHFGSLGLSGMALDLICEALGEPLVPFWLSGVALDLILDTWDLILETLDLILEAVHVILETLDLILEALDVILEALADILGMAWVLSWPGDPEWGWIALRLVGEQCFTRIQGSRAQPKWRVIWSCWALLSTNN